MISWHPVGAASGDMGRASKTGDTVGSKADRGMDVCMENIWEKMIIFAIG